MNEKTPYFIDPQAINCKSLMKQVGGSHYQKYQKQPLQFAEQAQLNPIIFCAFKYVCRYKDKNGKEDLNKALHCLSVFEEIGTEKRIILTNDYVKDFLNQFTGLHKLALAEILEVAQDKSKLWKVELLIKELKDNA